MGRKLLPFPYDFMFELLFRSSRPFIFLSQPISLEDSKKPGTKSEPKNILINYLILKGYPFNNKKKKTFNIMV